MIILYLLWDTMHLELICDFQLYISTYVCEAIPTKLLGIF